MGWLTDRREDASYLLRRGFETGVIGGEEGEVIEGIYSVGEATPEEAREAMLENADSIEETAAIYAFTEPPQRAEDFNEAYDEGLSYVEAAGDAVTPSVPLWMKVTAAAGVLLVLMIVLRPFVEAGNTFTEVVE